MNYTSTHVGYGNVKGPEVGIPIHKIIKEPKLYNGYKVSNIQLDCQTEK